MLFTGGAFAWLMSPRNRVAAALEPVLVERFGVVVVAASGSAAAAESAGVVAAGGVVGGGSSRRGRRTGRMLQRGTRDQRGSEGDPAGAPCSSQVGAWPGWVSTRLQVTGACESEAPFAELLELLTGGGQGLVDELARVTPLAVIASQSPEGAHGSTRRLLRPWLVVPDGLCTTLTNFASSGGFFGTTGSAARRC